MKSWSLSHMIRKWPTGLRTLLPKICSVGILSLLGGCKLVLMDPKGSVGLYERNLILAQFFIMLLVVVPVIFMAIWFPWRYRASNKKATYSPNWAHSYKIEAVVWGVPCLIVLFLAILCWKSTHDLDPRQALVSTEKPIEIDVVSLDWKWLFIYPEQHIAVVNQVAFPVDRPVHFVITSDSVMNSFFIPQLGSQIYAMNGMKSNLNLIANEVGSYDGMSANFSGAGFYGMNFKALAMTEDNFAAWVKSATHQTRKLDTKTYTELAKQSENEPVTTYGGFEPGLFDTIINKYMGMPHEQMLMGKDGSLNEGVQVEGVEEDAR